MLKLGGSKRYGKSILNLTGFEELAEALNKAGKSVDVEGRKCFEKCAENVYDALYRQASAAGLHNSLLEQITDDITEDAGRWNYSVGWKKGRYNAKNLNAWAKVAFYNYGTPSRQTTQGGQRVQISGKWVTLGTNRGRETSHPPGSHGFIKKAKLAAVRKNKKLQKEYLNKILKDLK